MESSKILITIIRSKMNIKYKGVSVFVGYQLPGEGNTCQVKWGHVEYTKWNLVSSLHSLNHGLRRYV
jgi:hypothetical protein